jgi:hypothetical protein
MKEMKQFIDDCKIIAAKYWSCVIPDSDEATV